MKGGPLAGRRDPLRGRAGQRAVLADLGGQPKCRCGRRAGRRRTTGPRLGQQASRAGQQPDQGRSGDEWGRSAGTRDSNRRRDSDALECTRSAYDGPAGRNEDGFRTLIRSRNDAGAGLYRNDEITIGRGWGQPTGVRADRGDVFKRTLHVFSIRANVFSFRGNVFSFRADVFTFQGDVFTAARRGLLESPVALDNVQRRPACAGMNRIKATHFRRWRSRACSAATHSGAVRLVSSSTIFLSSPSGMSVDCVH